MGNDVTMHVALLVRCGWWEVLQVHSLVRQSCGGERGSSCDEYRRGWLPSRSMTSEATASERDKEEEDDGKLVGPFPVEHDPDDMQAVKRELIISNLCCTRHS